MQNVACFDISMDDIVFVQILESFQNLFQNIANLSLAVGSFSKVHDVCKGTIFTVFHQNPQLAFEHLYWVAFDDIGMFAVS